MTKNFWIDRRVLVTGGNGFIGSWLTERILAAGAKVTLLIKKDDPVGLVSIPGVVEKTKIVYGDIRESAIIEKVCEDQETILHLAAITQVIYSVKNPVETVEVDVNGTLNIIEALRKKNENAFLVFASTDKVYGEPKYVPIDEEHPLSSKSPYDASKLSADRLVYSYQKTYGLRGSISRCSNVIGGRDVNMLRVVPSAVYFLMRGRVPVIRTDGRSIRDYMYVDDAVNALMTLAANEQKSNGLVFNFGTGKPTSVLEIVKSIISAYGKGNDQPIIRSKNIFAEIDRQYLSYKLAKEKLGWNPKTNLEDGVRQAVDWYKKNPGWLDVMDRTSHYYGLNVSEYFG